MSRGRDRLEVMVLEAQGLLAVEGASGLESYKMTLSATAERNFIYFIVSCTTNQSIPRTFGAEALDSDEHAFSYESVLRHLV